MDEALLEKLGLTKGEIKVYLALNKLGESTVGPIGSESKVSKSKIYDILEKLISKGLVGYIIKEGKKHFVTNDPKMISCFIAKKEDDLEAIKKEADSLISELLLQRQIGKPKKIAEIYEGFHGLKAIREELMTEFKSGDTLLVLGAPKVANDRWEGWLLDFHRKRCKNNVGMRIIYNADAKDYGSVRTKMARTQVRYLPNHLVSPNWIDIFPSAIMLGIVSPITLAIVIRNKELVESFRSYFDVMWKVSTN